MSRIDEGTPTRLGASWDGRGVNFALFSAHATAVDLCLFDASGRHEQDRLRLPARTDEVFHGFVDGVLPGQLYGYRVHGPYEPEHGHRFNPNKLLIDPYARRIAGRMRFHDALLGFRAGSSRGDLSFDRRDSAPMMPKCVVESPAYFWGDDRPPRRPWSETFIYEAHVRGLTRLHPDLPPVLRGSYAALGHPAVVDHLLRLGVTAIELLPIHAFSDDRFLVDKDLRNYWGYSTLAFFAPDPRYDGDAGATGLKAAIRTLHDAGIEVILDVVYNHTAEGAENGPTLSFRGIDNAIYYKHAPDDARRTWDCTGTGNTLDLSHPRVLQMVLDSLRHWVDAYHVDGFRFDLAPALARDPFAFEQRSGFLRAVAQDPVLASVKLIAEPWDVGDGGYRLGGFPAGWGEWNDKFRDAVRGFWRGDEGGLPDLARALTGSRETFEPGGRGPYASINYVACHDGYTLGDLVSYEQKHNEANCEGNRDGHDHNLSAHYGIEGPSDDLAIRETRVRQTRNLLATVLLSQGVPMIGMGDEFARTQNGNNNAYCQDNETSWLNWSAHRGIDPELPGFVAALAGLRRRHPAFRLDHHLTGERPGPGKHKDVSWLAPEGREMTDDDWRDRGRRTLGMQLGGGDAPDGRFLLLVNAAPDEVAFRLGPESVCELWRAILDTRRPGGLVEADAFSLAPGGTIVLEPRSSVLFQDASGAGTG